MPATAPIQRGLPWLGAPSSVTAHRRWQRRARLVMIRSSRQSPESEQQTTPTPTLRSAVSAHFFRQSAQPRLDRTRPDIGRAAAAYCSRSAESVCDDAVPSAATLSNAGAPGVPNIGFAPCPYQAPSPLAPFFRSAIGGVD